VSFSVESETQEVVMPLIALVLLSAALSAPPHDWRDSIRDVYIDGKLERTAQTLTSSEPRMIAVVCGEEVMLFDPDSGKVSRAPKEQFAFAPDRISATTTELAATDAGTLVKPDPSTIFAQVGDHTMLIAAHQSHAGPMTLDELWATAPVWRSIADVYQPDGQIVNRLKAISEPVTLQVVMATWCGDSRQHVPRLLKSIALADNPNITVQLTGIGPEFDDPMQVIGGMNITNVPTVIVQREGREVGRFVETPSGATVEDDVCDIVAGTPKPHPGRYERGALLTSGTYLLRDARRRAQGTEHFELYERPGGGVIAHSSIAKRDGTSVETWASLDAEKKPRMLEVTHRGATTTRTRFRRSGDVWSAHSRGADGGLVDQAVLAPETFVAPATITYAWARGARNAYVAPESGVGETRAIAIKISDEDVPRVVKLEDGSTRILQTRN
jgi:hypothetical protein